MRIGLIKAHIVWILKIIPRIKIVRHRYKKALRLLLIRKYTGIGPNEWRNRKNEMVIRRKRK